MSTYQLTISGDSPDSLRENVQAWLDSHEDGAGTRCEEKRDTPYQVHYKNSEQANVGDIVREGFSNACFIVSSVSPDCVYGRAPYDGHRCSAKHGSYHIIGRAIGR